MFAAPTVDPGADLDAALSRLAGEHRDGWTAPALTDRVTGLIGSAERLDAEIVLVLAQWLHHRVWDATVASSAAAWLARHTTWSVVRARRAVASARLVDRYEQVRKALEVGDLTSGHVEQLARTHTDGRSGLFTRDQHTLIDIGRDLDLDRYTKALRMWASMADDELGHTDPSNDHRRRNLHVSVTFRGNIRLDGDLTAEEGAIVKTAIDAIAHTPDPKTFPGGHADPTGHVDTVDPTERADATGQRNAARQGDATGRVGPTERVEPTELRLPSPAARPTRQPITRADLERWCDIDGIGPIALDTAKRLLCNAYVGRVIMRGRTEVLDLGRLTRFFTKAQRRAIVARDGDHCAWPDCTHPIDDYHHLDPYTPGGHTNLDLGVALCRTHHRHLHEHHWHLTRHPDGTLHTHPAP